MRTPFVACSHDCASAGTRGAAGRHRPPVVRPRSCELTGRPPPPAQSCTRCNRTRPSRLPPSLVRPVLWLRHPGTDLKRDLPRLRRTADMSGFADRRHLVRRTHLRWKSGTHLHLLLIKPAYLPGAGGAGHRSPGGQAPPVCRTSERAEPQSPAERLEAPAPPCPEWGPRRGHRRTGSRVCHAAARGT